ncbi:MAG: hypothetical protein IJW43_04050 [Clostridia bacterium]|nr:hypothetical protein [Clostridia bacterium]
MKRFLAFFLIICTCFSITGCSVNFDGNTGEMTNNATKLPTPNITRVSENYVYWEEVPNASSYVLKINSYQESVGNTLKYSIASIMDTYLEVNQPTELHIYVKAKGNQILYSDSEWSAEYVYTYTKTSNSSGTYSQTGLGYSVDIVNATSYGDYKRGVSVLDSNKLNNATIYKDDLQSVSTTKSTSARSISELIEESSTTLQVDVGVGVSVFGIFGGIDLGVKSSGSFKHSSYQNQYYQVLDQYIERYSLSLKDFAVKGKYLSYLSDDYVEVLGELFESQNQANFNQFFATYGTHIIGSAIFGGRLNAYVSAVTNKANISESKENSLKSSITFKGFATQTNIGFQASVAETLGASTEDVQTSFNASAYGGDTFGVAEIEDFSTKYNSWLESFNDNDTTCSLINYSSNGLIPLWDLLPQEYSSMSESMEEAFLEYYNEKYNRVVNYYKFDAPVDPGNIVDFAGGFGTATQPYLISNAIQLKNIEREEFNKENVYFEIIEDLDLEGYNWEPNAEFNGILNGNGMMIKNLSISYAGQLDDKYLYSGFIQKNNGTIDNIVFYNANIKVDHIYNSASERAFFAGIIAVNNGIVKGIEVVNSTFNISIQQEKSNSGHDSLCWLALGSVVGTNNGNIQYCKAKNCSLTGYSNGRTNYTKINRSIVGGVVGYNTSKVSDCISMKNTLSSESRGGCYVLFAGGGFLRSFVGYLVGFNEGNVQKCVSYKHNDNSIVSKTTRTSDFMDELNYYGLVIGRNTGTFDKIYTMAVGGVTRYIGDTSKEYGEYIKSDVSQISSIVTLWTNWKYQGEFCCY